MAVMRLNFFSRELGMATNVTAILPSFDQGFDVGYPLKDIYGPEEKFPVLWLLHGGSGDDADYLNWTNSQDSRIFPIREKIISSEVFQWEAAAH